MFRIVKLKDKECYRVQEKRVSGIFKKYEHWVFVYHYNYIEFATKEEAEKWIDVEETIVKKSSGGNWEEVAK